MENNVQNNEVINNEVAKNNKKEMDPKTKKILTFIGIILFVIGITILFIVAFLFSDKEENKDVNTNTNNNVSYTNKTYFMYMDIKPAIKLEIEERYNKCTKGECLYEIVVNNYSVIEEDTNEVFKGYKIVEKNELNNVLNDMLKHASSKGVDTSNVDFYSKSEEIGSYLELNTGLYGFYYSDISNPEEFYSRIEEDSDKEVTKEFLITDAKIYIRNNKREYLYNFSDSYDVSMKVTGTYDEVSSLDEEDFDFYVDAKDLKDGKHKLKLNFNNKYNSIIEVEIEPTEIEIVITSKSTSTTSTTTTITTTSTTKETTTTTKKTTSRNDVEINLNDNVKYFEVTSCGGYLSIKKECINSTIGELKTKYPDYNKELDTEEYFKDNMKLDTYQITHYFPSCEKTITNDTKNKLSKKQGFYMVFNDTFMKPYWVQFKDDKYVKFEWKIADFTSEDLYYSANCGGGDSSDINYKTLDEAACTKYNLPCARW